MHPDGKGVEKFPPEVHFSDRPDIDLLNGTWVPLCAQLFRRSIVERAGGWDVRYPLIEDVKFEFDCAVQKAVLVRCGTIMGTYREHAASLHRTQTKGFLKGCLQLALDAKEIWQRMDGIVFDAALKELDEAGARNDPHYPKKLVALEKMLGRGVARAVFTVLRAPADAQMDRKLWY